jgi:DNA-nicking Smr family endonuclease
MGFDRSVPAATRRALRQGSLEPEARLDLHGTRASDAAARLERFVYASRTAGRRCVLVITGRGLRSGPAGPVLRTAVVEALTHAPLAAAVLGMASAPPAHGGSGALLLLLRRTS